MALENDFPWLSPFELKNYFELTTGIAITTGGKLNDADCVRNLPGVVCKRETPPTTTPTTTTTTTPTTLSCNCFECNGWQKRTTEDETCYYKYHNHVVNKSLTLFGRKSWNDAEDFCKASVFTRPDVVWFVFGAPSLDAEH